MNQKPYTDNAVERLKRGISAKNIIAFVVFGMIIIVFALFGLSQKMSGVGVGYAADVNGKLVTMNELDSEIQNYQQYYQNLFGSSMDFSSQRQMMAQQALESLIRGELVLQAAEKQGIYVTNGEVREFLLNDIPFLQDKGTFSRDYYMRYLEYTKSSAGQFETKIRKQAQSVRMRKLFEAANEPSQFEASKTKELKDFKINLEFVQVSQQKLAEKMTFAPAKLNEALAEPGMLDKVKSEYESTKAQFEKPEEVKAQHILISTKADDPSSLKKAEEKMNSVLARIKKEDFGKVAKEVSDDPGSKKNGGDLGFFPRGRMVKEFDDVAFGLKPGQISNVVKTQFGLHIIKLNDKKAAQTADFEKAKFEILKKMKLEKMWAELSTKFEEIVKSGDMNKLASELKTYNLNWEDTGYFELGADAIPKVGFQQSEQASVLSELNPQQPFLKRVIRDGSNIYFVKYKDARVEPSPSQPQDNQLAEKKRGDMLFEDWINEFRKQSSIQTSPQAFGTNADR